MEDITVDQRDAMLLLAIADSGRAHEVLAQFIASYIVSGDVSNDNALQEGIAVMVRVFELMNGEGQMKIWPELLPGAGGMYTDAATVIFTDEVARMLKAELQLGEVIEIFASDESAEDVLNNVHVYLTSNNLITPIQLKTVDVVFLGEFGGGHLFAVDKDGRVGEIVHGFYTNLSNEEMLNDGDNLRVEDDNWRLLDGSEVHEILN